MDDSLRIAAGTNLAEDFPYSRAVRIGNIIELSGTGAFKDQGEPVGVGNVYEQAKCIYDILEKTLSAAGASMADVIKVTIYMTDITRWEEVARVHKIYFKESPPAVTAVEVSALITPEMMVEIEMTAVLTD